MVVVTVFFFATFAIVYGFILADLVGDSSTACAYGAADESTFASASECADCGAARGRSTNNLHTGVVVVILLRLLTLGAIV
jgi:hypothetical protein